MDSIQSRRTLFQLMGITAVGTLVGGCNKPDGDNRPPAMSEIKEKVSGDIEKHFGKFGRSILDSEVTNQSYLRAIASRAERFMCDGTELPLELYMEGVRDVGGTWANEMLLSAPVTTASARDVAAFIRKAASDDSIPEGFAVFGYQRFLDLGASQRHGKLLLGNRSSLIFIPGLDYPIQNGPVSEPSTPPVAPSVVLGKIYPLWLWHENHSTSIRIGARSR